MDNMTNDYRDRYIRLGKNIALYRRERGLTQEQLGDRLGTDQSHISRIENALIGISLHTLFAIADALEVQPGRLLENNPLRRKR